LGSSFSTDQKANAFLLNKHCKRHAKKNQLKKQANTGYYKKHARQPQENIAFMQ